MLQVSATRHMPGLSAGRCLVPMLVASSVIAAAAVGAQEAGHGATAADIERGNQTFLLSCASCHGPNGDTVPGVNLANGSFRRATSDQELANLIRNGIPGTAMPPSSL